MANTENISQPNPPRSRRGLLAAVSVAIVVGILAVLAAMPLLQSQLRPSRTLLKAGMTAEEAQKALAALRPDEIAALSQRERNRLTQEPLDLSALSNLALLSTLAGDATAAKSYSELAASRSLRDPVSQLVSIESYLQKGDAKNAFYHVDGLLSTNPGLGPNLFPILLQVMDKTPERNALAATLARKPMWRMAFLNWLVTQDKEGSRSFALFEAVRANGGAIEDEERRAFIARLVETKAYDRAFFFWLDTLSSAELLKVNAIYDGEFSTTPKNLYFDWNFLPLPNVSAAIVPHASVNNGQELRIAFNNNEDAFWHVFQILHLQPGAFTMKGGWASARFIGAAGLNWTVSCVGNDNFLGKSQAFANSSADTGFTFSFTVPPQGCDFQVLRLTNASTAKLDAKIDGDLEFFNLQIVPKS